MDRTKPYRRRAPLFWCATAKEYTNSFRVYLTAAHIRRHGRAADRRSTMCFAVTLLLWALLLFPSAGFAQEGNVLATPGGSSDTGEIVPRPSFGSAPPVGVLHVKSTLVGVYRPDGKFKKLTKTSQLSSMRNQGTGPRRPAEVPPGVKLRSRETVVQSYLPPSRAVKVATPESVIGSARDSVMTALYGHESVLGAPTHVTTDSRQRLIVSDPARVAVHVLDEKFSFRIAGGPGMRLQQPNGVAVDANDNIYVADGGRGLVLVYDPAGHFIRELGVYRGENIFGNPTGIAIDRRAGSLYVVDSPANELFVLDLAGNVKQRFGGRQAKNGLRFDYPSEVAVGESTVAVLDAGGARIQVLDLHGRRLNEIRLGEVQGPSAVASLGFALDAADNIYVSPTGTSGVKLYRSNGEFVGVIGSVHAEGVCVTPDRIYVAERRRSRVLAYEAVLAAKEDKIARR